HDVGVAYLTQAEHRDPGFSCVHNLTKSLCVVTKRRKLTRAAPVRLPVMTAYVLPECKSTWLLLLCGKRRKLAARQADTGTSFLPLRAFNFFINLRLAMSPPILYLVTTRSSAMVCSCSSSDMLAVKFPSLLGPTKRQLPTDQLGSDRYAAAARCTRASLRMPHKLLPTDGVTSQQPQPAKKSGKCMAS
ncbi:hypothetical protein XENOCAPTIV_008215, partial [Xenoophorus captivus]